MRISLHILLTAVLGFILQSFLPFWSLAFGALLVGAALGSGKVFGSFIAGFIGGALLWLGMAWYQHLPNDGLMAQRVSDLMDLGGLPGLLAITAVLGGLLAGLGSITGFYLRGLMSSN